MSPLASILIPAFNSEKWISDAIRSALAQTWANKEVIVVDDGSRDQTFVVAKEFESRQCKVITQKNRGASATRNTALSLAQGDFIQWLDADDLLAPDKIERQIKRVHGDPNTRTLLSSSFSKFVNQYQKGEFIPDGLWQDLSPLEFMLIKFRDNLWMNPSAWLVSRRLTSAAGLWDERLSLDDDGEYFCRVVLASEMVIFVPDARSYKRIGNFGLSSRISRAACFSLFTSMRLSIERVLAVKDSERVRKICMALLQRWFIYFYPEKVELVSEMGRLARFLGGELQIPQLGWKYSLVRHFFGWKAAKEASRLLPRIRLLMVKKLDMLQSTFSADGDVNA